VLSLQQIAKRVPIRPAKLPLASKAANTGNLHGANGSNLDDAQAIFAIVESPACVLQLAGRGRDRPYDFYKAVALHLFHRRGREQC
jgi:hypothetical protein